MYHGSEVSKVRHTFSSVSVGLVGGMASLAGLQIGGDGESSRS